MLRATPACNFSTCQLPKVVRGWCVLYTLTSKRASCHNGVQFFISHLARWLRARRFSEPTFRPSDKSLEKHSESQLFYLFPHLHHLSSTSFFYLFLLPLSSTSFFYLFLFFSSSLLLFFSSSLLLFFSSSLLLFFSSSLLLFFSSSLLLFFSSSLL